MRIKGNAYLDAGTRLILKKMDPRILFYALGIWFIFLMAAILNGAFRENFVEPRVGEYVGHVISTLILISVVLVVTFLFLSNVTIAYSTTDLVLIGAFWVIVTVLFEFLFFHYGRGESWDTLLADYNILKGRLWSLVLVTVFIAPLLFGLLLRE